MASIEITPLNISGVKLPFDLLDNLLGQNIDATALYYPLDLATNPQYCHAIQFTVHDYTYPNAQSIYGALDSFAGDAINKGLNAVDRALNNAIPNVSVNGIGNGLLGVGTSLFAGLLRTNVTELFNSAKNSLYSAGNANLSAPFQAAQNAARSGVPPEQTAQTLSSISQFASPANYKPQVIVTPLATISLYMPDNATSTYASQWSDTSLTNAFGIIGYLGNAVTDYIKQKSGTDTNFAQIIQSPAFAPYKSQLLAGVAGGALGPEGASIIQNQLKSIPNPQVQLLYKGIDLRTFQFTFTFTPASAKEADAVDQIIKSFTYYSLPDITDNSNGQFFTPPQIFRIKFAFLGSDGVSGQVFDIFKNTIGNLIGNQFTKILTGSQPTNDIAAAKNARIFEIGDCVLENVTVDYAPNGWATYTDGWPVASTLTLNFKEMDFVTKKSPGVQPRNISNYNDTLINRPASSYVRDNLPPV